MVGDAEFPETAYHQLCPGRAWEPINWSNLGFLKCKIWSHFVQLLLVDFCPDSCYRLREAIFDGTSARLDQLLFLSFFLGECFGGSFSSNISLNPTDYRIWSIFVALNNSIENDLCLLRFRRERPAVFVSVHRLIRAAHTCPAFPPGLFPSGEPRLFS